MTTTRLRALRDRYLPVLALSLLLCAGASAQTNYYQPVNNNFAWRNGYFQRAMGTPTDTISLDAAERSRPHVAVKNDTFYVWSPAANRWKKANGAGGTLQAVTDAGNGTTNDIVRLSGGGGSLVTIGQATSSQGHIQVADLVSGSQSNILPSNIESPTFTVRDVTSGFGGSVGFVGTDERTFFLPDKNGTFAMLDDVAVDSFLYATRARLQKVADSLAALTPATPDLQAVTDAGNETTNSVLFTDGYSTYLELSQNGDNGQVEIKKPATGVSLVLSHASINHGNGTTSLSLQWPSLTTGGTLTLPDASGTVATREWVTAQGYSTSSYTDANARAAISLTTTGSGAASYNSTTGVLNVPTPSIPTDNASLTNGANYITQAGARSAISLTTTGTSGAATYNSTTGVLNIPQYTGGSGTVTDVSIASANGFAGSVATSTTTPAITLSTSVNGMVKGNGTALSAAVAGTDYVAPSGLIPYITTSSADAKYEFVHSPATYAESGSEFMHSVGEFTTVASGTGTGIALVSSDVNHPGIIRVTTGSTATGRTSLQASTLSSYYLGSGALSFETSVYLPSASALSNGTDRYQLLVGLVSTTTSVNQTSGVYFLYDEGGVSTGSSASANWQLVCANSVGRTFQTTSTAVALTTWVRLRAEVNAAGTSVQFYINGTPVGTPITTNIPTTISSPLGWSVYVQKSLGTAARLADADFMKVVQTVTR